MRRRVSSLITHALRLIAGDPKPVRHHKLWLRQPDFPIAPDFTSIQDILSLPNYNEITRKFRLHSAPLAAQPDPHGHYAQGDAPRRCLCHADLWAKPQDPHRITLSPPVAASPGEDLPNQAPQPPPTRLLNGCQLALSRLPVVDFNRRLC